MLPQAGLLKKLKGVQNYKDSGFLRNEKLAYGLFWKGCLNTEVPLKSIDYNVNINNSLAEITITQTYVNYLSSAPIDVEYRFATAANVCFEAFEAEYEGKIIKGVIEEKNEAKLSYEAAVSKGRIAALSGFSSFSKDVLSISLGNIAAKKMIKIRLSYIQTLNILMNKFFSLLIPSTLSERYGKPLLEKNEAPLDFLSPDDPQAYPWTINITVRSPSEILFLKSGTHAISVEFSDGKKQALIGLDKSVRWLPNKDFSLMWRHAEVNQPTTLLTENAVEPSKPYCAMVTFFPDFYEMSLEDALAAELDKETGGLYNLGTGLNDAKGEFIFLLDRSGSMSEQRISMAIETLKIFIKSLPKHASFNIISFGSGFSTLFSGSVKCSEETITKAISAVSKFNADMGGTEILPALQSVYAKAPARGSPRSIFLISDGGVYNVMEITDLVYRNRNFATVYSVGIGNGASQELIEGIAVAGKGKFEMIGDEEDMSIKVITLLEHSISPFLSDFEIKFDREICEMVIPEKISYLRKNQPLELFFFFNARFREKGGKTSIALAYTDPQKNKAHSHEVVVDLESLCKGELERSLPKCAMFRAINCLERETLLALKPERGDVYMAQKDDLESFCLKSSLKYQILTASTAFLCIASEQELGQPSLSQKHNKPKIIVPNIISQDYAQQNNVILRSASYNKKSAGCCYGGGGGGGNEDAYSARSHLPRTATPLSGATIKEYVFIAQLQSLDGYWEPSEDILKRVGTDKAYLNSSLPQSLESKQHADRIWMTLLALAFLQLKFPEKRDGWVLIFRKGVAWLANQGVEVEKLMAEAKRVISSISHK